MTFRPHDLRAIPLFADIPEEQLAELVSALAPRDLAAGERLFVEGSAADRLVLLVEGEIEVRSGSEQLTIRPVAPVGEVGALAGLRRASTATAVTASRVLSIGAAELLSLFERHGQLGLLFHHNLLRILADKLERDRRRRDEMRANLVETQKALKRMRDALLEAEDTRLHRMMFEEMDSIVERNRRGHYLVDVPRAMPTRLRLDDTGGTREVTRLSNDQAHLRPGPGALPAAGGELTGVLCLGEVEFPVIATVEESSESGAVLALGPLIDEYAAQLEHYLARLQLLDVVL